MGGIYGERLKGLRPGTRSDTWQRVWKLEDWNSVHARGFWRWRNIAVRELPD
jgi:hypothetical protein